MNLAILPLSLLQLVPVTRIEEIGDERGKTKSAVGEGISES